MQTEVAIGLQACLQLVRLLDAGKAAPEAISLCKRNSFGKALDIARQARHIHGGHGLAPLFHLIPPVITLFAVYSSHATPHLHPLILFPSLPLFLPFFFVFLLFFPSPPPPLSP